jgi:hypothetical protein
LQEVLGENNVTKTMLCERQRHPFKCFSLAPLSAAILQTCIQNYPILLTSLVEDEKKDTFFFLNLGWEVEKKESKKAALSLH